MSRFLPLLLLPLLLLFLLFLQTTAYESTCSGLVVTSSLQYNVDKYSAADVGLPGGSADELLSEAICCDTAYRNYAEPNGFYKFPDISLFRKVNSSGVTIFYDVVCGIPLFQAPIDRSFEEWESETKSHGWPSFRTQEMITGNVYVNKSSTSSIEYVYSACGTYLGTNEADEVGDRFCMDLSCISGSEKK